jgi:hypothetical protein
MDSGMVRVEGKMTIECPGRIANVDAGYAAFFQDSVNLIPDQIELPMHKLKGYGASIPFQGVGYFAVLARKNAIPHLDHGVGGEVTSKSVLPVGSSFI